MALEGAIFVFSHWQSGHLPLSQDKSWPLLHLHHSVQFAGGNNNDNFNKGVMQAIGNSFGVDVRVTLYANEQVERQ